VQALQTFSFKLSDGTAIAQKNFSILVGKDFAAQSDNNTTLTGQMGDDIIIGRGGNDYLRGGQGNDTVIGSDGSDILRGGKGNDILIGNIGSDNLTGGLDNDIFRFINVSDSTDSQYDTIMDFVRGQDKIDLSALNFDSINQSNATKAQGLEYHFENGQTIIEDQASEFLIRLAGEIQLNNQDFLFNIVS